MDDEDYGDREINVDDGEEKLEAGFADRERLNIGLPSETDEFNSKLIAIISDYTKGDPDSIANTIGLCEKIPDIREKNLEMLILSLEALSDTVPQSIKSNILNDLVIRFRRNTESTKGKLYTDENIKIALIRYARLWLNTNRSVR